jgi:hypothetical protein
LVLWRDGFREENRKRGSRPDRHEVWATTIREVSALEAVQHVVFVEAILNGVKEALLSRVELSEDAARDSEERTAYLMKLLDLLHGRSLQCAEGGRPPHQIPGSNPRRPE